MFTASYHDFLRHRDAADHKSVRRLLGLLAGEHVLRIVWGLVRRTSDSHVGSEFTNTITAGRELIAKSGAAST